MTNKAKRVLNRLNDRRAIEQILESFNQQTLDAGSSPVVAGDQELKVLKEMNELQEWAIDDHPGH